MQNEETTQNYLTAAEEWDRGFVRNYGQNNVAAYVIKY
jgi:hypothetical protein